MLCSSPLKGSCIHCPLAWSEGMGMFLSPLMDKEPPSFPSNLAGGELGDNQGQRVPTKGSAQSARYQSWF